MFNRKMKDFLRIFAHLVNILGMNSKIYATAKEYVIKFMIFTICLQQFIHLDNKFEVNKKKNMQKNFYGDHSKKII
jgi:hypothetical protein